MADIYHDWEDEAERMMLQHAFDRGEKRCRALSKENESLTKKLKIAYEMIANAERKLDLLTGGDDDSTK